MNNIKQYKSGKIIFIKGDKIIDNIKVGNIIICGKSDKTPIGFIEKIINIEYINADIVFSTQPAVIEDAFEYLEIHKEINSEIIYKNSPHEIIGNEGILFKPTKEYFDIAFNINKPYYLEIYKSGKQKIYANGTLSVKPSLFFDYKYEKSSVTYIILRGSLSIDDITNLYGENLLLKTPPPEKSVYLTKVLIPIFTGINIAVDIYAIGGLTGYIYGSMSMGFKAGIDRPYIGASYQNGKVVFSASGGNPYFNIIDPRFDSSFNCKTYVGPKMVFSVYPSKLLANAFVKGNIYNKLVVSTTSLQYKDCYGIEAILGFQILTKVLNNPPINLYEKCVNLKYKKYSLR